MPLIVESLNQRESVCLKRCLQQQRLSEYLYTVIFFLELEKKHTELEIRLVPLPAG